MTRSRALSSDAQNQELIRAVMGGDTNGVAQILAQGADVSAFDGEALSLAAECQHLEVVRLLLQNGADDMGRNGNALWWAAYHGNLLMTQLLVAAGSPLESGLKAARRHPGTHPEVLEWLNAVSTSRKEQKILQKAGNKWAVGIGKPKRF